MYGRGRSNTRNNQEQDRTHVSVADEQNGDPVLDSSNNDRDDSYYLLLSSF